jgi:hypothetical protein
MKKLRLADASTSAAEHSLPEIETPIASNSIMHGMGRLRIRQGLVVIGNDSIGSASSGSDAASLNPNGTSIDRIRIGRLLLSNRLV